MNQRPTRAIRDAAVVAMLLCCACVMPACNSDSGSHSGNSESGGVGAATGGASASGTGGAPAPGFGGAADGGLRGGGASGGAGAGSPGTDSAGASAGGSADGGQRAGGGAASTGGSSGGESIGAGGAGAASTGAAAGAGGAAVAGASGAAGAAAAGAGGKPWSSSFPTFTKHTIAAFSAGYTTVVVDVDHDGLPDVVALSSGADGLAWFKNPSWKKYAITTRAKQLIFVAPYDLDGDGHVDLAIAGDFDTENTTSGGTISWAEGPIDPLQNQDWTLHRIDAIPTTHRLRWADIDGDGKKELIALPIFGVGSSAPAHAGPVQLKAYFSPAAPKDAQATWRAQTLDDTHLEVAHGLRVVDWDGDKAEDLLTAANDGIDLFRPALGKMAEHLGAGASGQAPDRGSSDVVLGSLGGTRFLAAIEFWHGPDAVVYTPGASESALWTRQVIGSDFTHGHGLAASDLNGDGYDEVIAGGGQGAMNQFIYRYVPSSRMWEKIQLDSGAVAVSEIEVHDMNADGAPDIVSIGASPTNNVVWYESSR